RLTRKFNEALISLLIEARYDKHRILEAYCNEVFLGQQGSQAVHGFAAAAEFYFGREVRDLHPAEVAMLVGLVRNEAPAFLDLVRTQLQRDYPADELQRAGLAIYTTLAPSVQALAEQALTQTLDTLGKK